MKKIFTVLAALTMAVSMMADVTVYCKNAAGWATINAYSWSPEVKAWPGEAMQATNVENVYSYTLTGGQTNIIFNNGNGVQTNDLAVQAGKCYNNQTNVWEDAPEGITAGGQGGQGGGQGGDQGGTQGGGTSSHDGEAYYYYKGYINGADVNDDQSWNVFDHGTVEYEFTEKSYLFVIEQVDGQPGVQYMCAAYTEAAHATLVKTGNEKLAVEAGKGTLYLYDNGDGTLELSTTVIPGKTLVGGNQAQAVEQVADKAAVIKTIENGQVVIVRGGVRYSAMGAKL